jgi:hypothetical protein
MRTMFLAAAAALSLGIGSAFATESSQASGYAFPDYQFPTVQQAPSAATAQNGQAVHVYATTSASHGTWLFPPNQNSNG